ncbi:hydroxyectoine utilization dehydratase EutB [Fodinisporobacter ferrooxydans]|uniref:Hydroxyectoine utilization dehydratase EutB n=1 Tax=Fodinisporobacter ferrooxydans TaxID=2901836 RepID=A0ABY4CKT1_9BACL|nr:hydroxyectoine utilization dehydratase EutB [Alicyclobacillaceae bacterium MYW30-H2]
MIMNVTIHDIWKARKRTSQIVKKTPFLYSSVLSDVTGASVYLKLENFHETGAFKLRGAANKILSLTVDEQKRGVTTFSTGNHGLAVAYVAKQLGIRAVICISNRVPKAKVERIRRLGAEIEVFGHGQDDAEKRCYQLQEEQGLTVIKPFDDPYVIAGQGTIGLELLEDLPDLDMVVAGLSGGGLISGLGLALKSTHPGIQVIGVSMEHGAVMYESLKAGKPVILDEQETLADSLLGGIGLDNQYTFRMVQQYMDQAILVSEEEIAEGMAYIFENHRMAVEGAAAVGVAALLRKKIGKPNGNIAVVISGCNVDISAHLNAVQKYISH